MPLPDFRLIRLLPLAALVLTACSVTTPKGPGKSPDSPQWRQHQQDVRNLNQFQTRGAFAYLSDEQKVYARFFWQQTGQDNYRLLLLNPLGSTELELIAKPGEAQITDNKGQHYTATDAEEMIGKLTGMPIPLNSLRQWIIGLPGDATDYSLDDRYRLRELNYTQNGKTWHVTYGGYTTLSRQTIERSTTPMLNTAITALQNAYAKATEKAVRDHLYAEIKAQRDASSNANKIDAPQLANMTIDDWVSLIIDASELADDRNVSLTRLAVSKDVLKALVGLKDTGDRFFNLSGDGSDTIGSFDLTGVAGTFMRVPVVLLPNADAGLASFIDPAAVTVWESGGPAQLTDGNVTGLTNSYSVYGYMAVATTHADGLIPVKFATA